MPNSMSLELQQKPSQNIKQLQRLIMSRQMQQAIHFLQIPVMELTPLVDMEMEQNPVLEYAQDSGEDEAVDAELEQLEEDAVEDTGEDENAPEGEVFFADNDFEIMRRLDEDFRDHFQESGSMPVKRTSQDEELQTFLEASVTSSETLFEHLMRQAQEAFEGEKQLAIAEAVIGNLDENGFLSTPLKELAVLQKCPVEQIEKVLKKVQTFHPVGVGACNLRDSLLIQLRALGKDNTLAYRIVDKHFDDLLHNRISVIKRGLHCTADEVGACVDHDIAKLDLHPGMQLATQIVPYAIPDITIKQDGDELITVVNEESQPRLRLNGKYLRMVDDETLSAEAKEFIKQKVVSAKWLMRNIMQRNSTLERIAQSLAKRQRTFFLEPKGKLIPLTMKTIADELEVHESTIARAVSNKYIDTPKGIMPLRSFFTNSLVTSKGDGVSSRTVRDILKDMIDNEDKHHPLSDEALSEMMKKKGIKCARRTVAKYRTALKLGTAQQRRKF